MVSWMTVFTGLSALSLQFLMVDLWEQPTGIAWMIAVMFFMTGMVVEQWNARLQSCTGK